MNNTLFFNRRECPIEWTMVGKKKFENRKRRGMSIDILLVQRNEKEKNVASIDQRQSQNCVPHFFEFDFFCGFDFLAQIWYYLCVMCVRAAF